MTKSVSFEDNRLPPPKTGQLSWVLDTAIVAAAAIGVTAVFLTGSIATYAAKPAVITVAMFTTLDNPDAIEAAAGPTGAPLLWAMKDADSTVYLFGSVPVITGEAQWMDQRLFSAFDSADSAWFQTQRYAYLPARATGGADLTLYRRADALRKARLGLDSNSAPAIVTNGALGVPYDAWRLGDEKSMTQAVMALSASDREVYEALQIRRNQKWLPQIEKALAGSGSVFVTVDAGHLVGPDGLISQLRKRGHKVTRMDPLFPAS